MCSQNARNVTSEPLILKIFQRYALAPLLGVIKYEPPRQNQNSTPIYLLQHRIFRFSIAYSTRILFIYNYTFKGKSLAMYAYDCVIRLMS